MTLGKVVKPSWNDLIKTMKGIKPSQYEVLDVSDTQGLQRAKETVGRMYNRSKGVSVIVIQN